MPSPARGSPFHSLGIENSSARVLPANTVCLSRTASVGYVVVMGRPMATSQDFVNWVCSKQLDPDFLKYLFIAEDEDLLRFASGAVHQTIYFPEAKAFHICHPPILEQRRIVGVLDQALAGLASAEAHAKTNLQQAEELFNIHLHSVFADIDTKAKPTRLEDVCRKITDGTHHSPKTQFTTPAEDRFLYITSKNIRTNHMDLSDVSYIERELHAEIVSRCAPSFGDVLLTKDGANTGNVTLNTISEPFSLLSSVCLIKTKAEVLLPAFLCFYLQSEIGLRRIVGQMTGAAIKRIVLKDIKRAVIPLPSVSEQQAVVEQLNALLTETGHLASIYQKKRTALLALRRSLLHQAFTGQL